MSGLTPSGYLSIAVVIVVVILAALTRLVGLFSDKWANRLGCLVILAMLQGSIMVLMLWAKE